MRQPSGKSISPTARDPSLAVVKHTDAGRYSGGAQAEHYSRAL